MKGMVQSQVAIRWDRKRAAYPLLLSSVVGWLLIQILPKWIAGLKINQPKTDLQICNPSFKDKIPTYTKNVGFTKP